MCGIIGYFNLKVPTKDHEIALKCLSHRGPDGSGEHLVKDVFWFGHTRLSIQDISVASSQPMLNSSGSICLTYNGEIYNAPSLRDRLRSFGHVFSTTGDTEVLLRSYEQWGLDCVYYLTGMFAFAIWDSNQRKLFLVRDRLGIKPLYYFISGNGIAFASEAKALVALLKSLYKPKISKNSLAYLFFYGYIPAPHAIWEGIFKLEPGHFLTIGHNFSFSCTRYWEPPCDIDSDIRIKTNFNSTFENVINDHLLSDVPETVFLSGGNDSMAVATAISRIFKRNSFSQEISAFTLGFDGIDDEVPVAKIAAEKLGLVHSYSSIGLGSLDDTLKKVINDYDEPMTLSSTMSMHQLCEVVSQKYKVALSGDGADEVFGGYNWYRNVNSRNNLIQLREVRRFFSQKLHDPFRFRLLGGLHRRISSMHEHSWRVFPRFFPEEIEDLLSPMNVCFDDEKALLPISKHYKAGLPMQRRLQRIDLMTFSTDHCCAKVDRSSMAYGLEVRVPFLDHRIVEMGLSSPVDRNENRIGKIPIKNYLKDNLPREIVGKRKTGFSVPLHKYYSQEGIFKKVKNGYLVKEGYINEKAVDFINLSSHPSSFARTWMIYIVGLWIEQAVSKTINID